MRKIGIGILGILTIATVSIHADAFSELDNALIAGKDFPFPPDESALPETTPSDSTNGSSINSGSSSPSQKLPQSKKSEKNIRPDVNSPKPNAGKDIFPPEED